MNDSRSTLRRRLLSTRELLSAEIQARAADAIVSAIVERARHLAGQRCVAGYMSYGPELSVGPTMKALDEAGIQIVLPVSGPDASMEFCPWAPGETLHEGRHGIAEPRSSAVELTTIGMVLVPGVGFANNGSRLGHGMGYYDRFFARCFSVDHDPRRLGIAHDCQVVELPSPQDWDVGVHEIITPSKVIHVTT